MDDCVTRLTSQPKDTSVIFDLCADRKYSFQVHLFNAGGGIATVHLSTFLFFYAQCNFCPIAATYDVQSLSVEEGRGGGGGGGGGGVLVRGELMSGSQAAGCLVVLQGPLTSPDIFRALQRTQSGDTVSTTIPLPPSNYTVYGYDLEENGLPNTMPAVIQDTQISSSYPGFYNQLVHAFSNVHNIKLFADPKGLIKSSLYLNNGSIFLSGPSTIEIDCEFSETYPQASCVLVYREYDSPLLTVVEFSQLINFPVSITVDSPENYTFALFGKDGALMDEKPLVYVKLNNSGKDVIPHKKRTVWDHSQ